MKPIEIHKDWQHLTEFIEALTEQRAKLSDKEFADRLAECHRVDRPGIPRITQAKWHSQEVRGRYLAHIMRGKIQIGS